MQTKRGVAQGDPSGGCGSCSLYPNPGCSLDRVSHKCELKNMNEKGKQPINSTLNSSNLPL